jgi:GT2 family glycosyltransferase/tetratricopeptide (TPR) repeat protein
MTLNYLLGPVSAESAQQRWSGPRSRGVCKTFNAAGDLDLKIGPHDSWEQVLAQLPDSWRPDAVVLELAYTSLPSCLWSAPVPIIGMAADWNLLWRCYRRILSWCDAILTDGAGVEAMRRCGWDHSRTANLYGPDPAYLGQPLAGLERDIDILFVGNLHSAVQRERLPWLGRLAQLASRYRVVIRQGVVGEDYRALLRRAKIVFNRSIRGECNRRAFEAACGGALLFQERGNAETEAYFRAGQECVVYGEDDLEKLLEHYPTHEDERRFLAAAGHARAQAFGHEALWEETLGRLEAEWPAIHERARQRPRPDGRSLLLARAAQAQSAVLHDPTLVADLEAATAGRPDDPALHNALGTIRARECRPGARVSADHAAAAAEPLRRALVLDPHNVVVNLSLVEALTGLQQKELAAEGARRALALLARGGGLNGEASNGERFPPGFDFFRVEWEKAAWANAGRPGAAMEAQRTLLRWRLHALLAELTGDLSHHHEAALARPDLPPTRASLGCALARAGRHADAVPHLRFATEANPFDRAAARALFQALTDLGDAAGADRIAADRRLLHAAAPQAVPEEAWFAEAPPSKDELASIIVLCCNEVEYTRHCLESVLRHTRPPYELVLVDNGSTDATPGYLEELTRRPGPARVAVIRNQTNVGFPAGCNQGLRESRGRFLVFLNNDTVVTAGWLDGLIAWARPDGAKIGLVGAVTNYSRPPQQIPADYTDPAGMEAFAARRKQEYAGKALATDRLTGFCLLARRDALEKAGGGFDEGFGLGFFDDDDLSLRVKRAGYGLLVALDVFVHHCGSRTFRSLGVDCEKQLTDNLERFRAKWGEAEAAGYRLPGAAELPADAPTAVIERTPRTGPMRVSLCMIVRNEELNLPECLGPAAKLFDEIVVEDTGSTDRTKEVAARYGAKVFDFPWVDSFSAARNEALRQATGDWVFWLDADDRLSEEDCAKLRALFAGLGDDNAAYSMKCLCLPDQATGTATVVDHVRLFRNRSDVRWEYRVHEQILPAIRRTGAAVRWSEVVVRHAGYQDPALRSRKLERDLRLLRLENADKPNDPFTLFNLGSVYHELGKPVEALDCLRTSLARSHPKDSIVRKLYALIAGCERLRGRLDEATGVCREGLGVCNDDAELLFLEGLLLRERGDAVGAEQRLRRVLETRPGGHFASVDAGLRGYKARHNLGVILFQQGRHSEAEAEFLRAAAERSDFLPAWLGAGESALVQKKSDALEKAAAKLEALSGAGPLEAAVLRGRGLLGRGDFAGARTLLEATAARAPREPAPLVYLSHALLQEGKDPAAAERVLRAILALDPANPGARHNLELLLKDRARQAADAVWADNVELTQLYLAACERPSDVNEHVPTLYALAKECRHVTEFGVRTGVSTAALLYAQPERLACYDRVKFPQVERLQRAAGRTQFVFHEQDVLWANIEDTDLLFIDTLHTYEQLTQELRLHADKVRKYIVLHDTTTFGDRGEVEGQPGLWPAVEEFLARGTFRLRRRYVHNNGLTVLEAVGVNGAPQ